ncbi:hypothetical protein [Embleya sp. NBC_00896]|nr:hypothetical protein OG928_07170 [Embleya sp. NBC_00896]
MSDNPHTADPGPADPPAPRDGKRLRLVTAVWAVLMTVAVVMIILMLRS